MQWRDLGRFAIAIVLLNIFDVLYFAVKVLAFHSTDRPDVDMATIKNMTLAVMFVVLGAVREKRP